VTSGAGLLIGDLFTNAAVAVPDRIAAAHGERSITFGALESSANRLARRLADDGVRPGTRVALWAGTDLDAVILFAAVAKLGALFMPVSGLLGADEASEILATGMPDLLVTDRPRPLPEAAPASTTLGELVELAAGVPDARWAADGLTEGDPHVAFFTSGSTGRPKGAVLSHRVNHLRSHPGALLEPRGAMVCPYPLFHMGAWTIALQQWQARDMVVFTEGSGADEICELVERHRATRLNCVPAVWSRILDHVAGLPTNPLATLRFADTGTSETKLELLEAIGAAAPNAHQRVFYGSTEAGSVSCLEQAEFARHPGSCGQPAPGVQVRRAEDGELWVSSTVLFDGYLDNPDATAACLVDGWYRTGDLVDFDSGFLSIVGRTGDLIRTGGEAVVPGDVEAVLADHPAVEEVAVIGLPDPKWGEVVCAVVVLSDGAHVLTLEELRECTEKLASFKQPRALRVVDTLPRTAATGQVQRRLLVERFAGDD
jgi:acyl-CoA synthetase (AMP-forming)/AMP-acid ligase II